MMENGEEVGCCWWWVGREGNKGWGGFFMGGSWSIGRYGNVSVGGEGVGGGLKINFE